jgi:hypothetical protein
VADQETTRHAWVFEPYYFNLRGPQTVPARFLKTAVWRDHQGVIGYFSESNLLAGRPVAVEFNHDHLCWVEVRYSRRHNRWEAFRQAQDDLQLAIPINELTQEEVNQVLGTSDGSDTEEEAPTSGPLQTTPSTAPPMDHNDLIDEPEEIRIITESVTEQELIEQAESLHITDTRIAATRTEEIQIQAGVINPATGHMTDPDEAAIFRAAGPD